MNGQTHSSDAELLTLHKQLCALDPTDSANRESILQISRELTTTLEDPVAKAFDYIFTFSVHTCMYVAADLNIYKFMADGPKTTQEIADATGAEKLLIDRIMRPLCSADIFTIVGVNTYAPTAMSNVYAIEPIKNGIKHMFDTGHRTSGGLPEFLRKTSFRSPTQNHNGPHQFRYNTKNNYFEWLDDGEHQWEKDNFNSFMTGLRFGRPPWVDMVPREVIFSDGVEEDGDAERPLLVDVGGGYGHDVAAFKNKFPQAKGKLVCEDLPTVLARNTEVVPDGVEMLGHDFFTPQPVHGARIYFMKTILHDWPDAEASQILQNLAPAMKRGYSKLLICDQVTPEDKKQTILQSGMDTIMMLCFASEERTKERWAQLLATAGMDIKNVWSSETGDAIIEAGLK